MIAIDMTVESSMVTKRTHKQIMKKLLRQGMTRHRDRLPKHFERNRETAPGGGYGYEPRSKSYQIRKAKTVGHQKPLVFSGRLRSAIQSNVKITSTANRARLRTRGYFPMKSQMRSEIEAISTGEINEMKSRLKRDYVRLANRPEYQRKRRAGGGRKSR